MKLGLNWEEHCRLGAALKRIRKDLLAAHGLVATAYRLDSIAVKGLDKAWRYVDKARYRLDGIVISENPEIHKSAQVYLGGEDPTLEFLLALKK